MDMCRIAGDKTAAFAEFVNASRVDLVGRKPIYFVDIKLEFRVFEDLSFYLFVKDLAFLLVGVFRKDPDYAVMIFARHWEEGSRTILCEARRQHVVRKFPLDLNVSDIEQALERASFKRQPEVRPNKAFCTIATGEILRLNHLLLAVCVDDSGRYARSVLRKVGKLRLPQHVFVVAFDELVEKPLVFSLFDDQQKRIRTHPFSQTR